MSFTVQGQPVSGSKSAVRNQDDDVIIIEPEIPIIDLCTPCKTTPAWSQLEGFWNRNPLPDSSQKTLDKPAAKVERSDSIRCGICLLSPIDRKPHATHCGHVFCNECLRRSMVCKKECPICKKFLCASRIFPLYI